MKKYTIIIPTYNRSKYLNRILGYYSTFKNDFSIIIGDSSTKEDKEVNKRTISLFKKNMKIKYIDKYSIGTGLYEKLYDLLQYIETEYCVVCADDDFINPSAIEECVGYLENNPDYSLAHGLYTKHHLVRGRNGNIDFVWSSTGISQSLESENPPERLKYHLSHYTGTTFHAVHRTEIMKHIWSESIKCTSDGRFGEILPTALSVIYGKTKILPIFYCSREIIPDSGGRKDPWSCLVKRSDFQIKCNKAINCMAEHLSKQEGIDKQDAVKIACMSLSAYLTSIKKIKERSLQMKKNINAIKQLSKKLHLYDLIVCVRNFCKVYLHFKFIKILKKKSEYKRILENKKSKYYSDFQKVRDNVVRARLNVHDL